MTRQSRFAGLGLACAVSLSAVLGHGKSRVPLALPPALPLVEPMVWSRVLSEPVGAFLVQGDHVWVRSSRAEGGGRAQGLVYRIRGRVRTTTSFYDSYDAATSQSQFLSGIGPGVVLAGVAPYCCGTGDTVVFEPRNGRWRKVVRLFPFPSTEFPGDDLDIARGAAPIVCVFGNPGDCMRWVGGKGIRTQPPIMGQRVFLDGRGGSNIAFSVNQLFSWRGGWKKVGKPLAETPEHVRAVKHGTQARAWLIRSKDLMLWDGTHWSRVPSPIVGPTDLFEHGPKAIWLSGTGGLGHFDGRAWSRVLGIHGSISRIAQGKGGALWVGAGTGMWRGTPRAGPRSVSPVRLTRAYSVTLPKPRLLDISPGHFRLMRTEEKIGKDLATEALGLAEGNGQRWLYDGKRLLGRCPGRTGGICSSRSPLETPAPHCIECLSLNREGLAEITSGLVRLHRSKGIEEWGSPVAYPSAISSSPGGRVWVAGSGADEGLPLVARRDGSRWEAFTNWPTMAPLGLASPKDESLWVAGADDYARFASAKHRIREPEASDETPKRPNGVLDHLERTVLVRYRAPSALFSVAKHPTEDLVVAVGADGIVVELSGTHAKVSRVPGAPWLYAAVSEGESLWVLGERGTLLRRHRNAWTSVPVPGFVKPAFTTIVRDGERWLVGGPRGLFELRVGIAQ